MIMRDVTCRVPREFLFCSDRQGSFVKNEKGFVGKDVSNSMKSHAFTILGGNCRSVTFPGIYLEQNLVKRKDCAFSPSMPPPPFQATRGVGCPPLFFLSRGRLEKALTSFSLTHKCKEGKEKSAWEMSHWIKSSFFAFQVGGVESRTLVKFGKGRNPIGFCVFLPPPL